MYWSHVYWLRFRLDNLVVVCGQMVSLVSVHGRCSPFHIYIYMYIYIYIYIVSFGFLLCQLDSRVSIFVFFMDTKCPVARQ